MPEVDGAQYDLADPCAATAPEPNNFFSLATGGSELDECPIQEEGVEGALERLDRSDGAPVNTRVSVPVTARVEPSSLSSTVTFALDQMARGTGVPASVMVEWTGASTSPEAFVQVEDVVTTFEDGRIVLNPPGDLRFGRRYYAVLTRAITDREDVPLAATPEVRALVAASEELEELELDEVVAERLQRERARVQPLLDALAVASPPIRPQDIVSVHSFDTTLGPERLQSLADQMFGLIEEGELPFRIRIDDANLTPNELSPAVSDFEFPSIGQVLEGRLDIIQPLGEELRIRPDWADDVQARPIRFTMTLPVDDTNIQGLAVVLPGYGRGLTDVLSVAELAAAQNLATIAFPLRCHGPRAPGASGTCGDGRTQEELDALDQEPNTDDERIAGPDGIPDDSGIGFFPGEAGALRDSQLGAALELIHLFAYLRDRSELFEPEIGGSFSPARIRLAVHGHLGQVATAALSTYTVAERRSPVQTLTLVQTGAGYQELVLNGPAELRQAFLDSAPEGISGENLAQYLSRLESQVLTPLDIERTAPLAAELFQNTIGRITRARIITQNQPQTTSESALRAMEQAWAFPDSLSPQLRGFTEACDEFLFFPCGGFNADFTEQARALVIQDP